MRELQIRTERARWAQAAQSRLLRKINKQPHSPAVRRVIEFLRQLQHAEQLRLKLYEARKESVESWKQTDNSRIRLIPSGPSDEGRGRIRVTTNYEVDPFGPEEYDSLEPSDFRDCLRQIGEQLRRLRWTPTVHSFSEFDHLDITYCWPDKSDNWENWAILLLLRQIKGAGRLPAPIMRFRTCQQCAKWLYTLTDHQVFCGDNCRKKFSSDSPSFREKRRIYMSKFRDREKENAKRAVRVARQLAANKGR